MAELIETRQINQLPLLVGVSTDMLVPVQPAEGGPAGAVPVGELFGKFLAYDVAYETRDDLFDDLDHEEGALALVYADPVAGQSGYYRKLGASGAGSWELTALFEGKDAYQTWLAAGNEGTMEEFFESLRGPPGPGAESKAEAAAIGIDSGASDLGAFEGSTIPPSSTVKQALAVVDNALTYAPQDNLYISVFARGAGWPAIHICVSLDAHGFTKINSRRWRFDGNPLDGYDPSITWFGGWFLIAVSSYVQDSYDTRVYRSRDLQHWEKFDCTFGPAPVCSSSTPAPGGSVPCNFVWAPEWYVDYEANEAYLLVSLQYAADAADIDGRVIRSFRPYYARLNDLGGMTFDAPVAFDIEAGNKIDPCIFKLSSGNLVCAIKDEHDKKIEFHTATAMDGEWTFLSEGPWARAEGPCITLGPLGTYRVFADQWELDHTSYTDTADFETFSDPVFIAIEGMHRHGTVRNIGTLTEPANIVRRMSALASFGRAPVRDGEFYLKPASDRRNGTRLRANTLRSGAHHSTALAALQALSGELAITVNGTEIISSAIDLSAAASFTDIAAALEAGFGSAELDVAWDDTAKRFIFTASSSSGNPTISTVAANTLANGLRLNLSTGASLIGQHVLKPVHGYCYYVQGDEIAEVTIDGDRADTFYLMLRTMSQRAGIILHHGDKYFAANGVADYIGFGPMRDGIVQLAKDYDWVNAVRQESGGYRMLGGRSRHLGYFAWDDRPDPTSILSSEMDSIDVGTTRSGWVATSGGWVPKYPIIVVRDVTASTKANANTSEAVLATTMIKAGTMGLRGSLRLGAKFQNSAADNPQVWINVKLGGQTVYRQSITAVRTLTINDLLISNASSATAQLATSDVASGSGTTTGATYRETTVDTTVDQPLTISVEWASAGDGSKSIALRSWLVELLP